MCDADVAIELITEQYPNARGNRHEILEIASREFPEHVAVIQSEFQQVDSECERTWMLSMRLGRVGIGEVRPR